MGISRKRQATIALTLSAGVAFFAFQNCGKAGFDANSDADDTLFNINSNSSAMLPIETKINQIAVMTCPALSAQATSTADASAGPFFSVRLGAFDNYDIMNRYGKFITTGSSTATENNMYLAQGGLSMSQLFYNQLNQTPSFQNIYGSALIQAQIDPNQILDGKVVTAAYVARSSRTANYTSAWRGTLAPMTDLLNSNSVMKTFLGTHTDFLNFLNTLSVAESLNPTTYAAKAKQYIGRYKNSFFSGGNPTSLEASFVFGGVRDPNDQSTTDAPKYSFLNSLSPAGYRHTLEVGYAPTSAALVDELYSTSTSNPTYTGFQGAAFDFDTTGGTIGKQPIVETTTPLGGQSAMMVNGILQGTFAPNSAGQPTGQTYINPTTPLVVSYNGQESPTVVDAKTGLKETWTCFSMRVVREQDRMTLADAPFFAPAYLGGMANTGTSYSGFANIMLNANIAAANKAIAAGKTVTPPIYYYADYFDYWLYQTLNGYSVNWPLSGGYVIPGNIGTSTSGSQTIPENNYYVTANGTTVPFLSSLHAQGYVTLNRKYTDYVNMNDVALIAEAGGQINPTSPFISAQSGFSDQAGTFIGYMNGRVVCPPQDPSTMTKEAAFRLEIARRFLPASYWALNTDSNVLCAVPTLTNIANSSGGSCYNTDSETLMNDGTDERVTTTTNTATNTTTTTSTIDPYLQRNYAISAPDPVDYSNTQNNNNNQLSGYISICGLQPTSN